MANRYNKNVQLTGFVRGGSVLDLHTMWSPKCRNLYVKSEIHVKQLPVYRCFIFKLHKTEMCFDDMHICVCLWENRGKKQ